MKTHDYSKYASNYADLGMTGSYYMAFKDIPFLLEEYANDDAKVLDYGCGAGRSLRFIRDLGYKDIVGVDISEDMINEAKRLDKRGKYQLIENSIIPYDDNTFDIIFMSYVFLEVGNIDDIIKILNEFKRVLKENGHIIFITSIVKNIKDKWISFSYDFEENNKPLDHCQNLKLLIKDKNIILHDYNWIESEYEYAIKKANLKIDKVHIPMGYDNEKYEWLSEKSIPYNYIYVLHK